VITVASLISENYGYDGSDQKSVTLNDLERRNDRYFASVYWMC